MNVIYLYKSGELKKKDYSLCLKTSQEEIYIPVEQVHTILCFGTITLNTRLLEMLNKKGISICFFNYFGKCTGRYLPNRYKRGSVICNQVHSHEQGDIRLGIAKSIQRAAFKNSINLLKYYRYKSYKSVDLQIQEMIKYLDQLEEITSIEDLLLLEARFKKIYFGAFNPVIQNDSFKFTHRSRNPPLDPINALISYGNTVLYGIVLSLIDESPLYPEISYIHSTSEYGATLHFDLADIYKPVLVDRIIIRLIHRQQLRTEHFIFMENKGCYLNEKGAEVFIREFQKELDSIILVKEDRKTYKSVIRRDIYLLVDHLLGKNEVFHPFIMKW